MSHHLKVNTCPGDAVVGISTNSLTKPHWVAVTNYKYATTGVPDENVATILAEETIGVGLPFKKIISQ